MTHKLILKTNRKIKAYSLKNDVNARQERIYYFIKKISFSPDGKCPTFYATSQYDPLRTSEF
jgi:hypothetical protein